MFASSMPVRSALFKAGCHKVFAAAVVSRSLHVSSERRSLGFYRCPPEHSQETKSIAVLFGWLFAKSRHLDKYGELYHRHGSDVITVKMEVSEILRPKKAERVAVKILDQLISEENKDKPIVIHGLSVGCYLYSYVLSKMENVDKYKPVKTRICGQVIDSPVDFAGVPYGVSNAVTENIVLRFLMKSSIQSYLALTSRYTYDRYLAQSELFHNNPVRTPSLFLFSEDDRIADVNTCQACADYWKNTLAIDVSTKRWGSSPHVSHFYAHNKEYIDAVTKLIRKINFPYGVQPMQASASRPQA